MEEISTDNIDTEKEFQNLLAKRNQLTTLLIATAAGTMGFLYMPYSIKTTAFILIGLFFTANIIHSLVNTDLKIDKICKGGK